MFCRLRREARFVENQACSLSGLHKTTLVWLTLWYSQSDSRHHSGKLVLTKCLRQAGMGHPNQGLVSQQDKRQPSLFQIWETAPSKPQHIVNPFTCLQGQTACFFSNRPGRVIAHGTEGLLHTSVPQAKGNPPCRAGREGIGHGNKTLRGERCLGHQYVAQYSVFLTNKNPSTDPNAKAYPRVGLWRTTGWTIPSSG